VDCQTSIKRPYTFVVMSILILILGSLAIVRTPTDIFPNINIPVVSIIWTYNGLVPEDMADASLSITERALTTTLIISSTSNRNRCMECCCQSVSAPTRTSTSIAQITAFSDQLKQLPAGSTPPLILATAHECPFSSCLIGAKPIGANSSRLWPEFYSDAAHHRAWRICAQSYGGKQRQGRWI